MSAAGLERVYGRRAVEEARRGRRTVHRVWEAPEVGAAELEALAGSREHQGIVAEVDPYPYADPTTLLRDPDAVVLVLDQVQDPHNLGAACRVAEFAGLAGVVIPDRRAASVTAAAAKASAGAVEHLDVARVRNVADWLAMARDQGAWIFGADSEAGERAWDVDLRGRAVIVMGAEESGLRPRVREACDVLVALPRAGRTESLNVSTAAAALVFEALRQRSSS